MTLNNEFEGNLVEANEGLTRLSISATGSIDGARTLQEAADMAKELAFYFEQLASLGYELDGIIDDDDGLAVLQ